MLLVTKTELTPAHHAGEAGGCAQVCRPVVIGSHFVGSLSEVTEAAAAVPLSPPPPMLVSMVADAGSTPGPASQRAWLKSLPVEISPTGNTSIRVRSGVCLICGGQVSSLTYRAARGVDCGCRPFSSRDFRPLRRHQNAAADDSRTCPAVAAADLAPRQAQRQLCVGSHTLCPGPASVESWK